MLLSTALANSLKRAPFRSNFFYFYAVFGKNLAKSHVEIRLVLSMSQVLLWRAITRRHHLLASGHFCSLLHTCQTYIWRIYITQQTYVQHNANAQSAILLSCGLHLDSSFFNLPFYLKASHQSGMLNRCWCNYLAILWHPLFKDAFSASDTLITS